MADEIEIDGETYEVGDIVNIEAVIVEEYGPEPFDGVEIVDLTDTEEWAIVPAHVHFTGYERRGLSVEKIEKIEKIEKLE